MTDRSLPPLAQTRLAGERNAKSGCLSWQPAATARNGSRVWRDGKWNSQP